MFADALENEKKRRDSYGVFSVVSSSRVDTLVNLTTTQVETLFGELGYIEPRLKALGESKSSFSAE